MTESGTTTDRLEALEIRIAHQDRLIAELNEVVTEQWRLVDGLSRNVARLAEEVRSLEPRRDGPEPPPPHY